MNQLELYEYMAKEGRCFTAQEIADRFGTSTECIGVKLRALQRYRMVERLESKFGILWRAIR